MTAAIIGEIDWNMTRDPEGHREYNLVHTVESDTSDGPEVIMNTPGLPLVGATWSIGNDLDLWAFCRPDMDVSYFKRSDNGPHEFWKVAQKFSTKQSTRCQDDAIEDPLMEPDRLSGSFSRITFEGRIGYETTILAAAGGVRTHAWQTTAFEPIRNIDVDDDRPTVIVEQNVADLGLSTFSQMVNTVNDSILWGLNPRMVKLSNVNWQRQVYGTCDFYYTRQFEFEVNTETFDRVAPNYGKLCRKGKWSSGSWTPSAVSNQDPRNMMRFHDQDGNLRETFLDADADPATAPENAPNIDLIYYKESNFLTLGIPTSL